MSACIPITEEKVRAELWMGDVLLAKTPFIKSFSVSKSRGQLSNTFSVTFEMIAGTPFPLGQRLKIKAGLRGDLKAIFTGFIESTQVSPAFAKPSYFSILLSGKGILSDLENKKFTRRLKTDGQGMFCLITGGSSANRPSTVSTLARTHSSGNKTVTNASPNPASSGGEHSQLTKFSSASSSTSQGAAGGAASQLAGTQSGGPDELAAGGGSGLGVHTHEDLDNGGPAFGVYSSD